MVSATRQYELAVGIPVFRHPEHPHLPPHPVPPGRHTAPALGARSHTPNSHCLLFYTWECICFNAILSNQPTLSLAH